MSRFVVRTWVNLAGNRRDHCPRSKYQSINEGVLLSEAIFDSFSESKEPAGRRLPAPVLIHEVTLYRSSFSTCHVASLLFIIQDEPRIFLSSSSFFLSVFICIRSIRIVSFVKIICTWHSGCNFLFSYSCTGLYIILFYNTCGHADFNFCLKTIFN